MALPGVSLLCYLTCRPQDSEAAAFPCHLPSAASVGSALGSGSGCFRQKGTI